MEDQDLDAALNELDMLSSCSKYKLDYLKAMETTSDVRRARHDSVPGTRDTRGKHDVSINVNSNYVTNISLGPQTRTPPDLSPFMMRRLQREAEDRRLTGTPGEMTRHECERHSCHSSHICSFVSPRRNRTLIRNSPYNLSASFLNNINNFKLRPSVSPLSGVLKERRNKSLGPLRGPVRFHDSDFSQQPSLYPLDDDLTSKLSSIQLSSDTNISSQPLEANSVSVTSELSKLVITRPPT